MTSTFIVTDLTGNKTMFGSSDTEDFFLWITNPFHVFNPMKYGADDNGVNDATLAFQNCLAAAVAAGHSEIRVPSGTFIIQDPDALDHSLLTDGPIRIPIGATIRIVGQEGATLKLGPNGCSKGMIRVFGRRCVIENLEFDLNGTVPVQTKNNVAIEINGAGGGTADVDGCDCIVRRNYVHGSRYLMQYSTGTISYDHTGGSPVERMVTLTGGSFPIASYPGVINIAGVWYDIAAWVTGNILQLSSTSNPGADVGPTTYEVNAEPYNNQGHDGIQVLNGNRNRIVENYVIDAGWNAIRPNGNGNIVSRNTLVNFRGNGIRLADGDYCLVADNQISSIYCSGRAGILADAGSGTDLGSPLTNADVRLQNLDIRNNYVYVNTNGNFEGAGAGIKLGAVRHCIVDGGTYIAGVATNNVALRIEDCIRKVTFQNLRCIGNLHQTNNVMTKSVSATVSRASGTYAGKLQLTITAHGLIPGKSLWLVNCPYAPWDDQEFIVVEVVDANNIVVGMLTTWDMNTVTPEPYNAASITGTVAHSAVHELILKNSMFERGDHTESCCTRFLCSPWTSIEDCVFEQTQVRTDGTVKESGILFDYPSDAYIKQLRIVRNEFRFNTTALCRCIRSTNDDLASSAATTFITAGKFICYGNRMENKLTGTVELVTHHESGDVTSSYDDRNIIFATEGENPNCFSSPALPTETWVSWTRGQTIRNTLPSSGGPPAWTCVTTGVGGSSLFKAQANLA